MKKLLLMRHAKSLWNNLKISDYSRDLSERGIKAAVRMGKFLNKQDYIPNMIICSGAKRAKKTCKLFVKNINKKIKTQYTDTLYNVNYHDIIKIINELPNEFNTIMIIGHNPSIEDATDFLSQTGFEYIKFPTAAIAVLEFEINQWHKIQSKSGNLREFIIPREIKNK